MISPPITREAKVPVETRGASQRIPALDFTKGALVLFMVLYHWLNYFISPQGDFYRYLRFVTPSFIFITGFLISSVYLSRYDTSESRLAKRLLQRGMKIFGVFILLNVIISLLFRESYAGKVVFAQLSATNMVAVYVTGNTVVAEDAKAAAFYILIPISYLLLISAALVIASRFYKHIFHVVGLLFLLGVAALHWNGLQSGNLELVAIGLLGVILGYVPLASVNTLVSHQYAIVAAYLCYTIVITFWNVVYLLQVVGVCLTVLFIYLLGSKNDAEPGRTRRLIILLGQYSLFGYIAQIAVLQLLHRGLRYVDLGPGALGISFLGAFALTILSVEVVHRVRARSTAVDGLYRAVFA
jgi:peptidoglycan/LPS O-acetylase OafA/YrhL